MDWVVVRTDGSLLSVDGVRDYAGLSDHYGVICSLSVARPPVRTRLVTSRNIRALCQTDFVSDVKEFAQSERCQSPGASLEGFVDVYDGELRQILDRHAPSATRRVRDRPSAPWLSEDLREARRRRRRAERRWRKTHLTVHREIFVKERDTVRACIQTAKRQHFSERIASVSS